MLNVSLRDAFILIYNGKINQLFGVYTLIIIGIVKAGLMCV